MVLLMKKERPEAEYYTKAMLLGMEYMPKPHVMVVPYKQKPVALLLRIAHPDTLEVMRLDDATFHINQRWMRCDGDHGDTE